LKVILYLYKMKIISTNIGLPTTIYWNGSDEQTGIYKHPCSEPLHLGKTDVAKDTVIDRKHHGGIDKACYLFSSDYYNYWKGLYPDLKWNWGMFGENLTIEGLDESQIRIGDIYEIGTATVQISQPREPCYKLGIRFGDNNILKQFIDHGHPGTYVRILEEGAVKKDDVLQLVEQSKNELTVKQFYELLFTRQKDLNIVKLAIENIALPAYKRERLRKFIP